MAGKLTPIELISARTAVVTTPVPKEVFAQMLPATLMATNLAASESVAVLFSVDGGVTFEPFAQDGADLVLTLTANSFTIISPIFLGVTKTATASASGVFLHGANDTPGSR